MSTAETVVLAMGFQDRLARLRKNKGLTQQTLADAVGMHMMQIHRYETGASQPTLEAIKKLAQVLGATADELVFGENERGPDEELRLQFEAISRFNADDKRIARAVLEGLILRCEARRWQVLDEAPTAAGQ